MIYHEGMGTNGRNNLIKRMDEFLELEKWVK
jgi:hypothetical protein